MDHKPTVYTAFDNRNGEMIPILSSDLFDCVYEPEFRDVRQAYLMSLRTEAKNEEAIKSGRTFLCGCCKRPLKIVGDINGKNCFHFKHIDILPEGECDYYDKVKYTKEEIKAMIFNGRTESLEHRQTKAAILLALENEPNIRQVAVEKVAKKVGKTWRKPDIRADFDDKTVVLEVQLSPIFQYVILERNDAYRNNGWYICWIFDDVNDDNPVMRKLDAWVNNNYNMFGFDDNAKLKTEETGRLHLTVKYYLFKVIEDGLESRLGGDWKTETVPFANLVFDKKQRMAYLHDSGADKKRCESRINQIKSECIRKAAETRRLAEEREELSDLINCIPQCVLTQDQFELVLDHVDGLQPEEIDLMLSDVRTHILTFDLDALNKWLKIACEIVKIHGCGIDVAKSLWNQTLYEFDKANRRIGALSLYDYMSVFGTYDYHRALESLVNPFNIETSKVLDSVRGSEKDIVCYAPLLLLNRYYKVKHYLPDRMLHFFSGKGNEINCLISAQMGKPFGYEKLGNLKQVANIVCNSYPEISHLFLHLIDRNGFQQKLSEVKAKAGKTPINHYQRLVQCVEINKDRLTDAISFKDLEIFFPIKR